MNTKPIYQSKIAIVNAITLILAILSMADPTILDMFHVSAGQVAAISSVLTIVLRFYTTGAVSLTGSQSS